MGAASEWPASSSQRQVPLFRAQILEEAHRLQAEAGGRDASSSKLLLANWPGGGRFRASPLRIIGAYEGL